MRRFPDCHHVLIALLLAFAAPIRLFASSDQRLLSLVPPGAQIVAGIDSPPLKGKPGSFVLITHFNTVDLRDFFALAGADSSRIVQHVLFVAMDDTGEHLNEHSLLASGHFDQAKIYKSAADGGARVIRYRDISVVEIQPFARERGNINEVRWLAVVDSDVLLFGSIASVQRELDRHLARSGADPLLAHRLAHMRGDDETWTVMSAPARSPEIRNTLISLDPKLAEMAGDGDVFQFGVRYGKQVEVEYEITTASTKTSRSILDSLAQSLAGPMNGSALLAQGVTESDNTVRGVVKISVARFGKWLAESSGNGAGAGAGAVSQ